MSRFMQVAGWTYVGLCAALIGIGVAERSSAPVATTATPQAVDPVASGHDAQLWFRRVKPYCNSVEIRFVTSSPPPSMDWRGSGFLAACHALAGQTDESRRIIDRLTGDDRWRAAGIVFDVGHPVAVAGDDRAAGPIMELVVDYWPNHYMALYHAGMAEYMLGQRELAKHNLTEFLRFYHEKDGWTSNANDVLGRLNNPKIVEDPRRPREP